MSRICHREEERSRIASRETGRDRGRHLDTGSHLLRVTVADHHLATVDLLDTMALRAVVGTDLAVQSASVDEPHRHTGCHLIRQIVS